MATYITVTDKGSSSEPYTAVKGCHAIEPLTHDNFYDSRNTLPVPKSDNDISKGTKQIQNIVDHRIVTAEIFELQADYDIDRVKATGCDQAVAFGFNEQVANYINEWNTLNKEKIKLSKRKKTIRKKNSR